MQFIVAKFSILHAGGQSLFKFQIIKVSELAALELGMAWLHPLIRELKPEGRQWGAAVCCIQVCNNLKFQETLELHVGGDDKL